MIALVNRFRKQTLRKWRNTRRHRFRPTAHHVQVAEYDYYRLLRALARCRKEKTVRPAVLMAFRYLLSRAAVVPPRLVGYDVVTMNTDVLIRTRSGTLLRRRLVYPNQQDRSRGWISVFSWTGISLLGRKEGDLVRWGMTIQKILYQPESRNHFHL